MKAVEQIISQIPEWRNISDIQYERISGLTNSNYCLVVEGKKYALRVSGENTSRLGINRDCERIALYSAEKAGLGAQVVKYFHPEGHLITQWVEGYHWAKEEFRTHENVRLLTEAVKRIHSLPSNGAFFSPFQRVKSFLDIARKFGTPLPSNINEYLKVMEKVKHDQECDSSEWQRFCHNDLVCVNYLYNKKKHSITVLDWEFAGMGDLYYDLATIVYTHDSEGPISQDFENTMLESYFGEINDQQKHRLLGMKFMLMFFTGAWALAQHGMVLGGVIQPIEGFDYLEFGEYVFTHDVMELSHLLI